MKLGKTILLAALSISSARVNSSDPPQRKVLRGSSEQVVEDTLTKHEVLYRESTISAGAGNRVLRENETTSNLFSTNNLTVTSATPPPGTVTVMDLSIPIMPVTRVGVVKILDYQYPEKFVPKNQTTPNTLTPNNNQTTQNPPTLMGVPNQYPQTIQNPPTQMVVRN
jgi:hypothetical protein